MKLLKSLLLGFLATMGLFFVASLLAMLTTYSPIMGLSVIIIVVSIVLSRLFQGET